MPLQKSPTRAAFGANVRTEMTAGKPQRQAVAIAESEKRKAKPVMKRKVPQRDGLKAYAQAITKRLGG